MGLPVPRLPSGVAKSAADAFAAETQRAGDADLSGTCWCSPPSCSANIPTPGATWGSVTRAFWSTSSKTPTPCKQRSCCSLRAIPVLPRRRRAESWTHVVPRPGALFVVGDPKQSIYRFRRADIALYDFVKERFKAFGKVLRLETNFRSLPVIADLVKGVFDRPDRFPSKDTDRQAAFAPLRSWRGPRCRRAGQVGHLLGPRCHELADGRARRCGGGVADRAPRACWRAPPRRLHGPDPLPPVPRPVRSRTGRLSAAGRCIGFRFGLRKGAGRVRPSSFAAWPTRDTRFVRWACSPGLSLASR